MAKKPNNYASAKAPLLASVINGYSEHRSRDEAMRVLSRIRALYSLRRRDPGEPVREHYEILWIRGFDLTEEERERGYRGNYGRVECEEAGDKHLLLISKVEMELKFHPEVDTRRPRHPMPNWSHPVLRRISKRGRLYKGSRAEAEEELNQLSRDYPSNTVRADSSKLYVHVFSRREDPKNPVQSWVVRIACDEKGGDYLFMERNVHQKVTAPEPESENTPADSGSLEFSGFLWQQVDVSEAQQAIAESVYLAIRDYDFRRLSKLASSQLSGDGARLYHFTSFDALKGILESDQLWLTDLQFTNDVSEIDHGWACVLETLHWQIDDQGEFAGISEKIVDRLDGPRSKRERVYGFSLCEAEELSSQWQVYGQGGVGVALGFEASVLFASERVFLSRIHYHRDAKREKILRVLRKLAQSSSSSADWPVYCAKVFSLVSAYLKHNGYYSEREWRLSCFGSPDSEASVERAGMTLRHRDTRNLKSVPYYQVDASAIHPNGIGSILKEVVVGPLAGDKGRRDVMGLLSRYGLPATEVRSSNFPLALS